MEKQLKIPDEIKNMAEQTALMATNFVIEDKGSLEIGAGVLMAIFKIKDTIETKRISITKPLNEALKAANGMFKPYLNKLDEAEKVLKNKIAEYKLLEDKRLSEEREKNLASIDPFDESKETMALVEDTQLKVDGLGFRNKREIEITDMSLIPKEYWILDMKKLEQAVLKDGKVVNGVKVVVNKITVKGR
jgi:hypothetical protein